MRPLVLFLLVVIAAAGDAWSPIWSMGSPRTNHTASLLPGGRVLVAGGGSSSGQTTATCEIYDLATGTWRSTGTMTTPRSKHAALLLSSGMVLVVGGADSGADCELYDPRTGVWTAGGDMATLRLYPTLTQLADGRVLAAGGFVQAGYASTTSCEIYDPGTGIWSVTGAMTQARTQHTATLLTDGRVFVAGGHTGFDYGTDLASCEMYNPTAGTWVATLPMAQARETHTATLLEDGRVLLAGGLLTWNLPSETFDPVSATFATTAGVTIRRDGSVSALLPGGRVLLTAGGFNSATSEVWDPTTGTWGRVAMGSKRTGHTATVLPSGQVLVLGGIPDGTGTILASGEVFTPGSGTRTSSTSPGAYFDAGTVQLPSGKVLAHDGFNSKEFDPSSGTWQASTNGFLYARGAGPGLALLSTGKVLCVGGLSSGIEWSRVELYDPATRAWTLTTPLPVSVGGVVVVPLLSGQVLVAGGSRCLNYDPVAATWSTTGTMTAVRSGHRAALLSDGRVLVAGGTVTNGYSGSCELYDPISGAWAAGPNMITPRSGLVLVPLANGRIMAVGGTPEGYSSCEFFDAPSGMWLPAPANLFRRYAPSMVMLASGCLLATAGTSSDADAPEMFDIQTGVWLVGEGLAGSGQDRARSVLPSGALLVGGRNGSGTAAWGIWQQPTTPARRPVVTGVVTDATGITITGSGFTPVHEGVESSPGNRPVVGWQRAQDGRLWWLAADEGFSNTLLHCTQPSGATGPGWLRVHVNGIASQATFLNIDPPAVSLSSGAMTISENGGSTVLTVTASRRFALPITVTIAAVGGTASSGDYALATPTLTIPAGSLAASTTLTGVADTSIEAGGETVVVGIVAVANGTESGTQSATITITDYQSPGFSVSSISSHTTEAGQTATFTVQPSSPPLSAVTLNLASTDSTEGVVSGGSSLVFTTGDWTTPRTITVTGVDDAIDDGNVAYQIIGSASSGDPDYNNRAMPAVAVINDDDDTAGIAIAAPVGYITEGGGSATVGVSLASQPTGNVTVGISSGATAQGTVGTNNLSFTAQNWNIPQEVVVTGADGDNADNPEVGTPFSLTATVTAGPSEYPTSVTSSRSLTCYPSNAAPVIAAVAAQTVAEDSTATPVSLAGIGAGGGNEAQTLTVTASSSDPAILPHPVVTYTTPDATGSLALTPVADATGMVTVTVRVTDDATIGRAGAKEAARFTETTFTVTVTALNDAPVIAGTTATPWTQAEDDAGSAGTLVGSILGGLTITDADGGALRGLAITAADTAHGGWQYNAGAGWIVLGAVTEGAARLLADDGATRLRFVPAGDYNGPASVTLRAWDRSAGVNGATGDARATSGTTAFSSATATAMVTVTPVNDAPVLAGTVGRPLTTVTGGAANPGTPVAALIQGLVTDVDSDPQGIAIVGVTGNGGSWSFSIDSGVTWGALSTAAAGNARLLSDAGSMLVRYAPLANEAGTASVVFRAWDRTSGSAGGTANITATGLTTAFSDLAATSSVTVTSGNAAPVLGLPTALLSYGENQVATALDAAATLTDADSADFAGGSMTVQFVIGGSSDDRLELQAIGGVSLAGPTVSVGGTAVATMAGGTGTTPLTLAWNAAATPALAQTVLRAVSLRNVSDDPSTAVRIVRATTSDGDGATSFPVTVTVTVAAVNDAPVITAPASAGTYVEDAAALVLAPAAGLADPDSPAFASGTLSATVQAGGEASDILAIRHQGSGAGQIGLSGSDVTFAGTAFGTFSGGNGPATPLVVLLNAQATQAAVQALLRNLTFEAHSQHPSTTTRTVRLRLADGNGGVSPDADVAVAVQAVNDAPSATVASWQVNPGASYAVPLANVAFLDPDEPTPETLIATLTTLPASGWFKLGVAGSPLTVGGQFSQRDLTDGRLIFVAGSTTGTFHAGFTVSDGVIPAVGPYDLPIQVDTTINELPDLELTGVVAQWQEDQPPVQVDPNATVTDADTPVFNGGQISATVTLNGSAQDVLTVRDTGGVTVSAGSVAVSGVVVGTVSGGTGSAPLTVILNNQATIARVERVVRAVSFSVESSAPATALRTVQVAVNDGVSAGSAAQNAQVLVVPVNSAPEVRLPRVATAMTENSGPQVIDDSASCSDEDSDNLDGGQATFAFFSGADANDRLGLTNRAPVTIAADKVNWNGAEIGTWSGGGTATLVVVLNASATYDKVQDLLRAATFEDVSDDPVAGTRVVRFSVSDGDGGTGTADIGVYVAAVNDAPVVAVSGGAVTWRQGDPPVQIDGLGSVDDVDSTDFAGGRLTASISTGASATDRLAIVDHGQITVAAGTVAWSGTAIGSVTGGGDGTTPLVVTLLAAATPDRVQDLLRALAFDSAAAVPTTQDRNVAVVVEDGDGGTSIQQTRVVQVVQVNLPPVVTLSGGSASYTEDQPAAEAIDAAAVVSDPDSTDFAGGRLTVRVTDGDATDRLSIANLGIADAEIGVSGTAVTWGGDTIGTWSGGTGTAPLVVELAAPAGPAALQGLVQALRYATVSQNPLGSRTIGVVLSDGDGGTSAQATRSVVRSGVNDAPAAAAMVLTVVDQAATGIWTTVDPEGDAFTWAIVLQPSNGTITLTDAATGAWSFAPVAGASGVALARLRVTDSHGASTSLDAVQVVITGPADSRPAVASDPPLSAELGSTWTWEVLVAQADIAGPPSLEVEAIGAPSGLTATVDGTWRATIEWPVPATATVGTHVRFLLRLSDRTSGRSSLVPVLIHLRAAIGGGG